MPPAGTTIVEAISHCWGAALKKLPELKGKR
jgi:hypothetical protein